MSMRSWGQTPRVEDACAVGRMRQKKEPHKIPKLVFTIKPSSEAFLAGVLFSGRRWLAGGALSHGNRGAT